MAGFRFPNESDDYRARRNELLELEKGLRDQVEAVARRRRELPLGGRLKEDYRFERLGSDGALREVAFADLFGTHESLLLYSMMFGADWDAPCPSCTSLVDAFNANYHAVSHHCAMAVVAAASPQQFRDWAQFRGWASIPLYSAAKRSYMLDYCGNGETKDPSLVAMMNVFTRTPAGIFHTWGSELIGHPLEGGHPRHMDMVWPIWNLLDMTPGGRGDLPTPVQDYEHAYFSEHVLGEES